MRYPRPRRREERTKTIIMTGGLNDIVTNLELKEGELYQVRNYMELDGPYHGYASIGGYERFDGKKPPSSVDVSVHTDEGNDANTVFLMEAPTGVEDISMAANVLENYGAFVIQDPTLFEGGCFRFVNDGYILATPNRGGDFASAFSEAYDRIETAGAPTLEGNWQIDIQVRPDPTIIGGTLIEHPGTWRLNLGGDLLLQFEASSDGVNYDIVLKQQLRPIPTSLFTHVSIAARNKKLRLSIGGIPAEDINGDVIEVEYDSIYHTTDKVWIGRDEAGTTPFTGYIDEVRFSNRARWYHEYTPPQERYSTLGYSQILWYDEEREDQRAKITEVPGIGPLRGVKIYQGEVYTKRDTDPGDGSDPIAASLWRANRVLKTDGTIDDDLSGWVSVDDTLNPGGRLDGENWRFSGAFNDNQVMCLVDGVSVPRIVQKTTDGLYAVYVLDGTYSGQDGGTAGAASNLPDNDAVDPRFAHIVSVFDNRLVLGYHERDLFLSSASDPGDFSGGWGAQLLVGDNITDFQELPGESLGVFCRNSVKVLKKLQQPTSDPVASNFFFDIESFSREAGALPWSAERVLDKVIYADDRGIVDFKAVDKYGDFDAAIVSKKLNRIFLAKRLLISTSIAEKQINQYRLYFSDGSGLYFTFQDDKVKGGTYVEFPKPVLVADEGEDNVGSVVKYFTSDDGYLYQLDTSTSFDGEVINTELFTSYYHYASPRNWKTFRRMEFEVTADYGTRFAVRPVFNYDESALPDTQWWTPLAKGFVGVWGGDNWGEFVWGGSPIQRAIHYMRGTGTNMSIEMRTASKYTENHVIHNCIVDYEQQDQQE